MTARKYWPQHAEDARMDAIALTLDIDHLQARLQNANEDGDRKEVARLNLAINKKNRRIRHLLQMAKAGETEYEREIDG
jgi:hypothetical protein